MKITNDSYSPKRGRLRRLGLLLLFLAGSAAHANEAAFKNGDVFAGVRNGQIARFSAAGGKRQPIQTGGGQMAGMCFDIDGNLYATDFGNQTMIKFNKQGEVISRRWGGSFGIHPESCVVDGQGNVFTGEVDGQNRIRKFDSSGRLLASFKPKTESRGVDWIDLAADQCTMFYTSEGSKVMRFDVCQNRQLTDFASGLEGACFALRVRENGEVMVACRQRVYRLGPRGSVLKNFPIANESLFAMNLDPDGEHFWTGGIPSGRIYKVHIESGLGTARPAFQAPVAADRSGKSTNMLEYLMEKASEALDRGGMGGLAVYGERTAAIAETVRRQEEEQRLEEKRRAEAEQRAEDERRAEAEQRAAAERREKEERLAEEKRRADAERLAEEERQRLEAERLAEEERQRLEAERLAEEERQRLKAERLAEEERQRREEEERRKRWRVDFGPTPKALELGQLAPENEAKGRLDLSNAQVEGEPIARLTTDLEAGGVQLEIETEEGWQAVGREPIEVTLADGVRQWSLRARVGKCTEGIPADRAHHLHVEAPGGDQTTARLDVPLSLTVEKSPWLVCWWPVVAGGLGFGLLGLMIHGFVSPSRFGPRVGVVISPEDDMEEGFFHAIRAQRGSGSGFYRDARLYIGQDFRLTGRAGGAAAKLRAEGKQVHIQPLAALERQSADGEWEAVPSGESRMRPGVIYRNSMKTLFFELGNR